MPVRFLNCVLRLVGAEAGHQGEETGAGEVCAGHVEPRGAQRTQGDQDRPRQHQDRWALLLLCTHNM